MSKHLGNILEPIPLMDAHGADAVRWFMAAGGSPWQSRRVGHGTIQEVVRKTLLTYWNTVVLPVPVRAQRRLGAVRDAGPRRRRPPGAGPVGAVRGAPAGRARSTRRWRSSTPSGPAGCWRRTSTTCPTGTSAARGAGSGPVDPAALATLHECLYVVTLLLAPLIPFVTERVWQDLFASTSDQAARSRSTWRRGRRSTGPLVDEELADADGARTPPGGARPRPPARSRASRPASRWARALVAAAGLGRAARRAARPGRRGAQRRRRSARCATRAAASSTSTPRRNFRALGKRFGKGTPSVAAAVAAADARALAAALREHGTATVDGRRRRRRRCRPTRWSSPRPRARAGPSPPGGETVALDLDDHPGAAPGGPGPRRRTHCPGGAQDGRARRVRPHRAAAGRPPASSPSPCASTAPAVADEVLATASARAPSRPPMAPDGAPTGLQRHRDAETGLEFWFRRVQR